MNNNKNTALTDAAEIWAAAQLVPGEGIEDGIDRIESILAAAQAVIAAQAVAIAAYTAEKEGA